MTHGNRVAEGLTVTATTPTTLDLMIAARCNLACPFCYGPDPAMVELLDECALRAIIVFAAERGVSGLVVAGGEPLLSPHLDFALRTAQRQGLWTALQTNGTMIERLREVVPLCDWVCLPLDSVTPKGGFTLRTSRVHLRHFRRAVRAVRDYNDPPRLKVGTVVTRQNIGELPEIATEVAEATPRRWKLYELRERGAAVRSFQALHVGAGEIGEAVAAVAELFPNLPIHASFTKDTPRSHLILDPNLHLVVPIQRSYLDFGGLLGRDGSVDNSVWCEAVAALDTRSHDVNALASFPE